MIDYLWKEVVNVDHRQLIESDFCENGISDSGISYTYSEDF